MKDILPGLLDTTDISDLRARLARVVGGLTIPQSKQLREHASYLCQPLHALRLGVIHTYTSDLLDPWLELSAAIEGLDLETYHSPYGMTFQEAHADSGLVRHRPDITLLLLQWQDIHPGLTMPIASLSLEEQSALRREVLENMGALLGALRAQQLGLLVLTLLPGMFPATVGMYDTQFQRSEGAWWAQLKLDVGTLVREQMDATFYLDLDQLRQQLGQYHFFDQRLWYSASYPFTSSAALALALRVLGIGASLKRPRAKVIVLDADNTLWGGVIGEEGMHGIHLGPDYPGRAFVDFQRRILHYQNRGFILALCSKNNPGDVEEVLSEHPHQVIKDSHFAAKRVNWLPKPENLASLAEELNLGLDSFIFVDDSAHECGAVRMQLPQVEVVQVPSSPLLVPTCLEHLCRLEVLSLTDEDLAKTQMYSQERQRKELLGEIGTGGGGIEEYLRSLNMVMEVGFDDLRHVKRFAQLTQKTNQFNLTTRRYNEAQVREFIESENHLVAHFSISDNFGDSGIVGLAIWQVSGPRNAVLDTFLMSCRVIGRRAEEAFLNAQLRELASRGIRELSADYLATEKNAPVAQFLPESGFDAAENGGFNRKLEDGAPGLEEGFPINVKIITTPSTV